MDKKESRLGPAARVALLLVLCISSMVMAACYWSQALPVDISVRGIHGLFDRSISAPILLYSASYAILLSFRQFATAGILYFGAGVFMAISVALVMFVPNSGGLLVSSIGGFVLFMARRVDGDGLQSL